MSKVKPKLAPIDQKVAKDVKATAKNVLKAKDEEEVLIKESGMTVHHAQNVDKLIVNKKSGSRRVIDDDTIQQRLERRKHIKRKVTNIAFEGGGIKAFAYSGAIYFLEEYGLKDEVKEVSGSSAGGMTAMLFALGLSAYDIFKEMLMLDYERYADDSFGFIRDTRRFIKKLGIYKGEALFETIEEILHKHTGNKDITFQQLYDKTKINLILTGTCIDTMKTHYFSKDNKDYPDMKVSVALRISMCLPYAYQYYEYKGSKFVDGAMFNNLPISCWDKHEEGGRGLTKNMETIGMMISNPDEIKDEVKYEFKNVIGFTVKFIQALIDKASYAEYVGERIDDGKWLRIIEIDTGDISVLKFDLSNKDQELMFENGYKAAAKFFEVNDSIDLVFSDLSLKDDLCYDTIKAKKVARRTKCNAKYEDEGGKKCSCNLI